MTKDDSPPASTKHEAAAPPPPPPPPPPPFGSGVAEALPVASAIPVAVVVASSEAHQVPAVPPQVQARRRSPPPVHVAPNFVPVTYLELLALHLVFGLFGATHFRTGRVGLGLIHLFTLGCVGWGWLVDLTRLHLIVAEYNRTGGHMDTESSSVVGYDLASMWILSLLGVPHFWVGRVGWGFFHLFTLGGVGVSFLADIVRFPIIAKQIDTGVSSPEYSVFDCYVVWLPLGLFGAHHYYLGNWGRGLLYTFTFGLLGLGWLTDFCNIPSLVDHANYRMFGPKDQRRGLIHSQAPLQVQQGHVHGAGVVMSPV